MPDLRLALITHGSFPLIHTSLSREDVAHLVGDRPANLFVAACFAVLVYSATFCLASEVLNVVTNYRLPIMPSAVHTALLTAVQIYRLGVAASPDDTFVFITWFLSNLANSPSPDSHSYLTANSWSANALQGVAVMGLRRSNA